VQIVSVVLVQIVQLQHARHAKVNKTLSLFICDKLFLIISTINMVHIAKIHPRRIAHVIAKHQGIFGVNSNKIVFLVTINAMNANTLQITVFHVPLY